MSQKQKLQFSQISIRINAIDVTSIYSVLKYINKRCVLLLSIMWIFGLPPPGGPQNNSELNVRFFCNRLYKSVSLTYKSRSTISRSASHPKIQI